MSLQTVAIVTVVGCWMYGWLVLVLWIIIVAKYVVLNFISNNCAYVVFRPFYWLTDSRVYVQTTNRRVNFRTTYLYYDYMWVANFRAIYWMSHVYWVYVYIRVYFFYNLLLQYHVPEMVELLCKILPGIFMTWFWTTCQ